MCLCIGLPVQETTISLRYVLLIAKCSMFFLPTQSAFGKLEVLCHVTRDLGVIPQLLMSQATVFLTHFQYRVINDGE